MTLQLSPFDFTYARSSAGVSLSHPLLFKPRQVIWLVGASGSGKSTFLHLLKGFYPEFLSGRITGNEPAVFKHAMFMAQNPASQIVHERVGEEFFFTLENNQDAVEKMHHTRHWLAQFGLSEHEFSPTSQLSHGLAQRLLLASQLAAQPEWLLLDEPTAFLNPKIRDEFYLTLKALKNTVGIVLIDHHPHAADFADICWYIDAQGRLSEMSVANYLSLQQDELNQETQKLNSSWPLNKITPTFTLRGKHLKIGYKNKPLFSADFTLSNGECAVLMGENGTGKSTLFNTLANMHKPLSGQFELTVSGELQKKPSEHMAYVFQHPDSHFYFDTIAEDLTQFGISELETTLAQIGLPDTAHRSPHQLSEGQKRRLTLLYPCLQGKPLILLDEPTFGQDAVNALRITRLILDLKQAGHAIIVITHDVDLQHAIADYVWTIAAGELRVSATQATHS
ncbi:ATP-binding cassette domain-containing protein [Hydromonas duriensis]|uniref:Energy-coupling factor transport system ATP-binding protein n=1 Tax=Hydromonas duriensis TaxID=1527608 RepID=A0A4R6YB66_9BURK|nr:ABC transporter ATP-binding protein [Hydromonas duriensis]TDR32842.1 energy-coupling factor transport system ATP-binding protein [Hydromonas duriensis]